MAIDFNVDEAATVGNILTIHGYGLKIEADDARKDQVGVFFRTDAGACLKAKVIAVNEPRTLKVVVPSELCDGESYKIAVITMSSAKGSSSLLKDVRQMTSEFAVTAHR